MNTKPQQPVTIDASDQVLGRLAVRIANTLRGKDNVNFVPYKLSGPKVVVTNAARVRVTGRKLQQKIYYRHTGWPRGLRFMSLEDRLAKEPERVISDAVKGMLPKNRLRDLWMKRLTVLRGQERILQPRAIAKPSETTEIKE